MMEGVGESHRSKPLSLCILRAAQIAKFFTRRFYYPMSRQPLKTQYSFRFKCNIEFYSESTSQHLFFAIIKSGEGKRIRGV